MAARCSASWTSPCSRHPARSAWLSAGGAVTLDLSAQFIGGGMIGEPLEARIELLRETSRMIFLRGLIVQENTPTIASFTGTLRKSSPPPNLAGAQ